MLTEEQLIPDARVNHETHVGLSVGHEEETVRPRVLHMKVLVVSRRVVGISVSLRANSKLQMVSTYPKSLEQWAIEIVGFEIHGGGSPDEGVLVEQN